MMILLLNCFDVDKLVDLDSTRIVEGLIFQSFVQKRVSVNELLLGSGEGYKGVDDVLEIEVVVVVLVLILLVLIVDITEGCSGV